MATDPNFPQTLLQFEVFPQPSTPAPHLECFLQPGCGLSLHVPEGGGDHLAGPELQGENRVWDQDMQLSGGQGVDANTQLVLSGELSEKAVYCKLSDTSRKFRPASAKAQELQELRPN